MSEKPPPKQSPYSPFPFGSPLGISKSKVEASSNGFQTNSASTSPASSFLANLNSPYLKGRVRAKEAYGGPVVFGGHSTNRKSRLLSASPYTAAAISSRKPHQRPLFEESTASSRRGSSAANTPSPAPSPSPSSTTSDSGMMSSTARLIFDTLEKMSTPVRDAQKLIPSVSLSSPPRAEKRRLIAEQLDWCHDSLKRRRPRLGQSDSFGGGDGGHLNGPPLRTVFSPLPPTPKPRSTATKSARLSTSRTGGSLDMSSQSMSYTSKPSKLPDLHHTPISTQTPTSGGGKMRTKICETGRSQKSSSNMESSIDPAPAFIASYNAPPLPLKSLPVISYDREDKAGKESTASLSFSSGINKPHIKELRTKPKASPVVDNGIEVPLSLSFKFSKPSPAKSGFDDHDVEDQYANGVTQFLFCQPEQIVSSLFCKDKSPSLATSYHTTDISTGHTGKLPDITAQMPYDSNVIRTGSVMDVLGQNNALPDVTASAGIKVATSLSTESVMSFLGRK